MSLTLSTQQAAEHFGVSLKTIRRWITSGKVHAEMEDGRWHVHIDGQDVPPIVPDTMSLIRGQLERADSEIFNLRSQLTEKDDQLRRRDEQIDYLTQVIAMSQKNITLLAEQLDGSKQQLEDLRNRTVWQRVKAVFKADAK